MTANDASLADSPIITAQFTGKGSDIFSIEGLKMILWGISIVGMPFVWTYANRWLFRNISLPTGTQVSFKGTARQVYGFFVLSAVLGLLKRYDPTASEPVSQVAPLLALAFALVWSFALL